MSTQWNNLTKVFIHSNLAGLLKLALMAVVVIAALPDRADADDPVYFADAKLKAAVEESLDKSSPTATDMLNLTHLNADNREIADLTGLEYAPNLTELYLHNNQISDISVVSVMTGLTQLWLSNNQISDISVISQLTSLTSLFIDDNPIIDLSVISELTNLTQLGMNNLQASDISVVSGLSNLTSLWLEGNQLSDISPVSPLVGLMQLELNNNLISDISALSDLTNMQHLGLSNNQLSDISTIAGLTNMKHLELNNNQISDISALSELTLMEHLELINNPLNTEAYDTYLPLISDFPGIETLLYDPTLTVNVIGGNGTVDPCEGIFDYGSELTLTAMPDEGYRVTGWFDANDVWLSAEQTLVLLMDSDKIISIEFELIPPYIQIDKLTVKAGKLRGEGASVDSFIVSGKIDPDDLETIKAQTDDKLQNISISVVYTVEGETPGHVETLDTDGIKIDPKKRKITYKAPRGSTGGINSFNLNLVKGTLVVKAKKIDLSGLRSPVVVEIEIGDYSGSGVAGENENDYIVMDAADKYVKDIINGKKPVPMPLLLDELDAIRLNITPKFKYFPDKQNADSLSIKGDIALQNADLDIAGQDVVIRWGTYTVTLPADDLHQIGTKKIFKYKKPKGSDSSVAVAIFNLKKCTFKIVIKKAAIGPQDPTTIPFGIAIGESFDETVYETP